MMVPLICWERPEFPSVASFIASYRHAVVTGRRPWGPETPDEYAALQREFPAHVARYRPARKAVKPLDQGFRQRLFATIASDPEWAKALALLLQGAAQDG